MKKIIQRVQYGKHENEWFVIPSDDIQQIFNFEGLMMVLTNRGLYKIGYMNLGNGIKTATLMKGEDVTKKYLIKEK